ncbi:MAG: hypothetical protein ACLQIQ_03435, partial [Beijerinckiaceae bacterium]
EFEKIVEDAIFVPHGVVPFSCPDESRNPLNRLESMPCSSSRKNEPDSRGTSPAMTAYVRCSIWN